MMYRGEMQDDTWLLWAALIIMNMLEIYKPERASLLQAMEFTARARIAEAEGR